MGVLASSHRRNRLTANARAMFRSELALEAAPLDDCDDVAAMAAVEAELLAMVRDS